MTRLTLLIFLVGATLAHTALAAPPASAPILAPILAPTTAPAWRQAALDDIAEAYQITLDNHAGAYDPYNPGFIGHLKQAKEHSLGLAEHVHDAAGYVAALQDFTVGIHDGHAGLVAQLPEALLPAERWPGFVAVWRGDALLVYAALPGEPAAGSQVISCDGVPINDLIRRNVFPYRGQVEQAGDWWFLARRVFVDEGNPFVTLPATCVFAAGGVKAVHPLHWRASTAQSQRWREASFNGDILPVGLSEPAPRIYWAAMPTFEPDENERAAYRSMEHEVSADRQRYLDARAIVIDLRDNMGGASSWSQAFAGALWGKERVDQLSDTLDAKTEVWWRASPLNTAYMAGLVGKLAGRRQQQGSLWAKTNSDGMQAALDHGQRYYVQKADTTSLAASNAEGKQPSPAFTKPVYVIVPGQCASACLDALDVFTRFPNTKLIGAPSGSDSTYMEIRKQALSSGHGFVIVPMKAYLHRSRANGQAYTPAIAVADLGWTTAAFLKSIETDLAERGL